MWTKFFFTALVVAVVVLSAPRSLATNISFQGLGFLAGGAPESEANAVSADGSVVVGSSGSGLGSFEAFRWTASGGMVGLGVLPGMGMESQANGVSADGSVVVGSRTTLPGQFQAYRWTQAGGMVNLGNNSRHAYGVSADGAVVVGERRSRGDFEAFRWTETTGVVGLGFLPHLPEWSPTSYAFGVSADGAAIVGSSISSSSQVAFRWTDANKMIGLGDLIGGSVHSGARAASSDGSVIVGYGNSSSGQEAFRRMGGVMSGLGDLPGGIFRSIATSVSADGSVVVGSSTTDIGSEAFVWDALSGMRNLKSVLTDGGLDLAGWTLTNARGVSTDGRTIVGVGVNPTGQTEAWRAVWTLGPPKLAGDFNGDLVVDAADYPVWRNGFGSSFTEQDYHDWKANFGANLNGAAAGASTNTAAIPEPTRGAILIVSLALIGLYFRCAWPGRAATFNKKETASCTVP